MPVISGGGGGGTTEITDFSHSDIPNGATHVHCWPFEESSDGSTVSASVGEIDLTVNEGSSGHIVLGGDGPSRAVLSNGGGRYAGQYVTRGASNNWIGTSAAADWGDGDFTLSLWFRESLGDSTSALFSVSSTSDNNFISICEISTQGLLKIEGNGITTTAGILRDRGEWHLAGLTRNQSTGLCELWLDGMLVDSVSSHTTDLSSHDVYIAARRSSSTSRSGMRGWYGEANIWSEVLDRAAWVALWNDGKGRFNG